MPGLARFMADSASTSKIGRGQHATVSVLIVGFSLTQYAKGNQTSPIWIRHDATIGPLEM
jgi:hypothetical protein